MSWYKINARKSGPAEILIYGEIGTDFFGDGIGAKDFRADLKALGDVSDLDVRINSEGGDVFDAHAIFSALTQHRARTTVYIDGIAASAASVIAMAGDRVLMPENAMLMIHDPWTMTLGNSTDLRKTADTLDKAKEGLLAAYGRTGLDRDKLSAMMEEETWMTAAEALDLGFIDEMLSAVRLAASANKLRRYRHPPEPLLAELDKPEPQKTIPYEDVRRRIVARRLRNTRLLA